MNKELSGSKLIETHSIFAPANTDFWSKTCWKIIKHDGACDFFSDFMSSQQEMQVCCQHNFTQLHDQAGIICFQDQENWVKYCVEKEDDSLYICTVITKNGFSDCSYFKLNDTHSTTTLFFERHRNYFKLGYIDEVSERNNTLRVAPNLFPKTTQVGIFAASPQDGNGFTAQFTGIRITHDV